MNTGAVFLAQFNTQIFPKRFLLLPTQPVSSHPTLHNHDSLLPSLFQYQLQCMINTQCQEYFSSSVTQCPLLRYLCALLSKDNLEKIMLHSEKIHPCSPVGNTTKKQNWLTKCFLPTSNMMSCHPRCCNWTIKMWLFPFSSNDVSANG